MEGQPVSQTATATDASAFEELSARSINHIDAPNAIFHYYHDSNVAHNSTQGVNDKALDEETAKCSINTVQKPTHSFRETQKYCEVLRYVAETPTLILQFYGVPGSGKTEMVLQLAEKFPFEEHTQSLFVKWYVKCEGNSEICNQFEELLQRLKKDGLLRNKFFQDTLSDMKKGVARSFVSALRNMQMPVLLIIEDMKSNNPLIKDFLRHLEQLEGADERASKVHVYFTTRKKSAVLCDEFERSNMRHYKMERVCGFNEEESVKFLTGNNHNLLEKESAKKIFKRFSGSPLGLKIAKRYCQKTKLTYEEYLDWTTEHTSDGVHQEKEEDLIELEYGKNWQHVFQAVVMPLHENRNDKDEKLSWNVLSCLSYMHQTNIPRFILSKLFQLLREESVTNPKLHSKRDSGLLISKLADYEMCTDENNDCISFHEVVFHAFRICQPEAVIAKFDQIK